MARRGSDATGGKRKGRGFWTFLMWLAIAVFVGALGYLGVVVYSYWDDNARYEEIADTVFSPALNEEDGGLGDMKVDWDALRAINEDIVAWIYIPDSRISYPVCWSGDNETYLRMDFDGNYGVFTGCGTIFLDAENSPELDDQMLAIYGHHMIDGSMFATLSDYADKEVFEGHRTVYVLTPERNMQYRTFALVRTDGWEPLVQANFGTREEMTEYIADKQERSIVGPNEGFIEPGLINQVLMLSTCDYNQDNGRAVLYGYLEDLAVPRTNADEVIGTAEGFAGGE